ncbi:MAG: YdcF family protein [Huintestinicola sp.]
MLAAAGEGVSILLFLLFAASAIIAKPNFGSTVGCIISAVMLFMILKREEASALVLRLSQCVWGRILLTAAAVIAGICIIAAVLISVLMARRFNVLPDTPQTVIVLGCRVKESGPSLMLTKRIDAAYKYLCDNPEVICIPSGGKGEDEPISEAQCIRDTLVKKGISPDRIIMESRSENTYQNIMYSGRILDELGMKRSAVVITSEFHQLRASMIARKQGFTAYSKSSRTLPLLLPSYWIREWFGVTHEYFIGRR